MRYELVEKINGKKKPRAGKGMGRILTDHSRICCMPFVLPREASKHTRVFLPFWLSPHFCKCIESNPLFK
jgi:hypothetical protein